MLSRLRSPTQADSSKSALAAAKVLRDPYPSPHLCEGIAYAQGHLLSALARTAMLSSSTGQYCSVSPRNKKRLELQATNCRMPSGCFLSSDTRSSSTPPCAWVMHTIVGRFPIDQSASYFTGCTCAKVSQAPNHRERPFEIYFWSYSSLYFETLVLSQYYKAVIPFNVAINNRMK